jgi:hypothetical protein
VAASEEGGRGGVGLVGGPACLLLGFWPERSHT